MLMLFGLTLRRAAADLGSSTQLRTGAAGA
jgi:hypothetical protein